MHAFNDAVSVYESLAKRFYQPRSQAPSPLLPLSFSQQRGKGERAWKEVGPLRINVRTFVIFLAT